MHAVLLLSCLVTVVNQALGELEYYPEYRKPGAISKWSNGVEVPTDYELQQLVDFLRKRPRLQEVPPPYVLPNRDQDMLQEFTYQFPKYPATAGVAQPFAVDPSDPRYYLDSDDDIRPEPKTTTKISRPNKKDDELERSEDQSVRGESTASLRSGDFDANNGHWYRHSDSPRWTDEDNVRKVKIVSGQATEDRKPIAGIYIIAIVAGVSAAATVGLIAFAIGWYNLQKNAKAAADVEYPAYGVTGPNKDVSPSGDRRLAQSAQMYHYQHQKQQIIAMENRAANERHGSMSEADSEDENEEGDYTVYECPGLAPTGEMEVKNPLFQDDPTPASGSASLPHDDKPIVNDKGSVDITEDSPGKPDIK